MSRILLTLVFTSCIVLSNAQVKDLPFGKVVYADLEMKSFPADTSADVVVLNEVGQAHISEESDVIYEHYYKIKILRKSAVDRWGDIRVALYKSGSESEALLSLTASAYNLNGASMQESKFDPATLFSEKKNEHWEYKKGALANVHEGTVIEVLIKTSSPFRYTFQPWEFQADVPKVHSEYLTVIPGNWVYTITLRGFLKLARQESTILRDCFEVGGRKSDCVRSFYSMDNIPAFKVEEHMTANQNFLSSIYFELSEFRSFDGLVKKFTLTWKDAERQLWQEERFGRYVKKSRSVWEDKVKELTATVPDELGKAKAVYNFIAQNYTRESDQMFASKGAKEIFEARKGNSAELNLALVGALQALDLKAFPVILSTRDNGLPIELYPVLSSFNYVIASVEIGGKVYLLDVTNSVRPFGMLPMKCLNGKGRLMDDPSSWIELKPADKQKTAWEIELTLTEDDFITGKVVRTQFGYNAVSQRGEIAESGDPGAFAKKLQKEWGGIEVTGYDVENLTDPERPLIEKIGIRIPLDNTGGGPRKTFFINPFVIDRMKSNSFTSAERFYPVDYGAPMENIFLVSLTYPADLMIDELPKGAALVLPQNGGRYLFSATPVGNKLSITSMMTLTKPVYSATEYHALRELYSRMIQIQDSQIVLKTKP
jgi:hypothetical protein